MTVAVGRPQDDARLTIRNSGKVVGNVLGMVAIVLCIPFVILAIGAPFALFLRLLLWIAGLLLTR